jgi:hypothetical protein
VYNDVRISPQARLFLATVTRDEWLQLQHMIDGLAADPSVDWEKKFTFVRPPAVWRLYFEYPFRIFYRLHDPQTLHIDRIDRGPNVPSTSEWNDFWHP